MNLTLLENRNTSRTKPTSFSRVLIVLMFIAGSVASIRAQVSVYTVEQEQISPAFGFLPSGLGGKTYAFPTTGVAIDDAVASGIPIPFPFTFNGATHNSLNISINGFITFGAAPAINEYNPISSTAGYAGAIAIYGSDLDLTTANTNSNVAYHTIGAAPNRIFRIEWRVKRSDGGSGADTGSDLMMQIWLYETTNVVELRYQQFTATTNTAIRYGQIGLRGTTNADFNNLDLSANPPVDWPWAPGTIPAGTTNTATVGTRGISSGRILAASNRLFRFTPVTCFSPTGLSASNVTNDSVTLTWTAASPAPANDYQYYITTSPTPPNSGTPATGTGATSGINVGSLSPSTQYYVYVRSDCGPGDTSAWSTGVTFTTLCDPVSTPYALMFDTMSDNFTIPGIPFCSGVQQLGSGSVWETEDSSTTMGAGFFDDHLVYNGVATPANTWFFTQGVTLVAGTTYRLSYLYGGSTEFSFLTNRMEVAYGLAPHNTAMTTQLANHTSIKASPIENIVNFTCTVSGTYYFGFRAYSAANMGKLYLDDIQVVEPGCRAPINLQSGNITGSSALITWDPATSPAASNGYEYYLTNTDTPPAYAQTATGTTAPGNNLVTLTGLSGNTTYYIWVRSACGPNDLSEWSLVHSFTTLPQPVYTYCNPNPSSVDATGIINVTVGTINNSTGAEPGNYGNYSHMITNIARNTNVNVAITFNTSIFTYNTKIWIDWNNDSDFCDAGEIVYTGLSGSSSPNTLNASFFVPVGAPLGEHRMRIGGADIDLLNGCAANIGPCYTGSWGSFEDYTVNVVVQPPALTISQTTSTQCALTDSPLVTITSNINSYDTFVWSPAGGVTGDPVNGYIFNNSTSNTYTLVATQTSFPFSTNSVTFTYLANPLPTPITVTPASTTSCESGPAVQITASGGIVAGLPILEENFNGTAPGWTTSNSSTGGATSAPAWTLRPNGYNPAGSSGVGPMSSPDATQFYVSNSDAQGSGTQTNVTLMSPVFSLAGYTSASLSFYHYYKPWTNGYARVSISIDGGSSWTQIFNWGDWNSTTNQGTATNFANVIYNLDSYALAGETNMRVKFDYYVQWGFVWAIDNFLISGSATSAITWEPVTGLYNDAAATIPYTGTGTSVVYAMPSTTTTYTASASTPAPTVCETSTDVTITVTPIAGSTVTPATQSACGGISAITLNAGYTGSILGWQWSTSPTFATFTNIPSSASPTLTPAQIGSFAGTRYYRPVITGSGCTAYGYATMPPSPTYASVTYTSTTWSAGAWSAGAPNATTAAIFAGNYTSSGNLTACSVQVNSGNVVFNPGHTLTVENAVNVAGGTLTFEDDASLVQVNDAAVNSGYITYKRTSFPMRKFDYTYWSSPLYPQTLVGLSPLTLSDKYFRFDTALNTYVNVPANSLMDPGQGYIVRAPQTFTTTPQPYNAVFNGGANDGVPNNGIFNRPIVYAGANFNLLGNPYPSAIDADLFYAANSSMMTGMFYFWTHNTPITGNQYTGSDYAMYNAVGGVGTEAGGAGNLSVPTGNIASGQGFFIKSTTAGTAVFNNSMRLVGLNNQFYRMASATSTPTYDKHRVWLEMMNNEGAYKQTLVGYVEGASNDFQYPFDGELLEAGNVIELYSLVGDNKLGIQGRALPFDMNDIVPLGYKSTIAGTFTIGLADFDGLFESQEIYLEDKLLNEIHNLKSGAYSFTTLTGTFDDRFQLRYSGSALGTGDHSINPEAVVVYKNDSGIHIHTSGFNMDTVTIFDIRGRMIYSSSGINADVKVISGLNIAEQVLVVKVITSDNKTISRKIVY